MPLNVPETSKILSFWEVSDRASCSLTLSGKVVKGVTLSEKTTVSIAFFGEALKAELITFRIIGAGMIVSILLSNVVSIVSLWPNTEWKQRTNNDIQTHLVNIK